MKKILLALFFVFTFPLTAMEEALDVEDVPSPSQSWKSEAAQDVCVYIPPMIAIGVYWTLTNTRAQNAALITALLISVPTYVWFMRQIAINDRTSSYKVRKAILDTLVLVDALSTIAVGILGGYTVAPPLKIVHGGLKVLLVLSIFGNHFSSNYHSYSETS